MIDKWKEPTRFTLEQMTGRIKPVVDTARMYADFVTATDKMEPDDREAVLCYVSYLHALIKQKEHELHIATFREDMGR